MIMGVRFGAVLLAAVGMALVVAPEPGAAVTLAPVTYAPAVAPQPAAPMTVRPEWTPILLVVDSKVPAGWRISQAADAWEAATGCDLFTFTPDGRPHLTYTVTEVPGLTYDGHAGGALSVWPWVDGDHWVHLNPDWVDVPGIVAHELGHTLGLEHSQEHNEVMSQDPDADRSVIRLGEATEARERQVDRCGDATFAHVHAEPVRRTS
jgi:hypothetical protein